MGSSCNFKAGFLAHEFFLRNNTAQIDTALASMDRTYTSLHALSPVCGPF